MATEEKQQALRGILKTSSSFDQPDVPQAERGRRASGTTERKEMKWDEMNIIATLHPPGKDYGLMKIDEPPTPYSKYSDPEDEDGERRGSIPGTDEQIDPSQILSRLEGMEEGTDVAPERVTEEEEESEEEEEDQNLTEEEKKKLRFFEQKRKLHYNDFFAVKLAKQLMDEEEEEEEEDEDEDEEEDASNKDSEIKTDVPVAESSGKSETSMTVDSTENK